MVEKLTNGTAGSPNSPNPGPDEPSIYYDATESRMNTNNTSGNKATIASTTPAPVSNAAIIRESKDNKERGETPRPHSAYSKIPVPVKSPRCSLSESTPDPNTANTKTGTGSELEKSPATSTQSKDKDSG